jgi:hypothetical protein
MPPKRNRRQGDFPEETNPAFFPGLTEAITTAVQVTMAASANPVHNYPVVKLPAWCPEAPEMWFTQVRAQFAARGIVDQRIQYDNVLAVLPSNVLSLVNTFVNDASLMTQRFDLFQTAVLEAILPSRAERFQQFHTLSLGDRKPTEILQRMYFLCPDEARKGPTEFFRQCFINKMPNIIQSLLSVQDSLNMAELSKMADQMVGNMRVTQHTMGNIDQVSQSESVIEENINWAHKKYKQKSQAGSRALCFYHDKYGKYAKQCQAPCDWKPSTKTMKAGNEKGDRQ